MKNSMPIHGAMMGKKEAIQFLTEEVEDHLPDAIWQDYEMAVNRVRYEFRKISGTKPKLYKAKRRIHDYWMCGNCGDTIRGVEDNYCTNCGYMIVWDSIRCLTK